MKRILTITALSSVLATGALAATEEQTNLINQYAPDVNVEMLSDQQVIEAFAIANSGDSDIHKGEKIEAIAMRDDEPMTFSAEQMAQIEEYLPTETVMMMTGQQRGDALAIINGADTDDDVKAQLMALADDATPMLTPAEVSRVETLAPDADLTMLTAEQVSQIRALIYTDENDAQLKGRIMDVVS